jgi:hypothetical protein
MCLRPGFARLALLLAAAALALAIAPPAATAAPLSCGDTITHDTTLTADLLNCPGDGLVIGADDITVDLNGHTIDGTVTQTSDCDQPPFGVVGINNEDHDGVTIENGTVQQFANGVSGGGETSSVSNNVWRNLTVRDNRFDGITMGSPGIVFNDNRIVDDVLTGNGCGFGIAMNSTHATYIAHNDVVDNGLGILICCSDHNVVEHNLVRGTAHDAVVVCCDGADNVIRNNTITHSEESGIVLCCGEGDQHTLVSHNTIAHNTNSGVEIEVGGNDIYANDVFDNGDGIAFGGDRNEVTDNRVSDSVGCPDGCGFGITFEGGTDDVVARNVVSRTLKDGIRIESFAVFGAPPAVDDVVRDNHVSDAGVDGFSVGTEVGGPISGLLLRGNTALRSDDDGFDVRSSGTTLTSNHAFRNADFGIDAVTGITDGGGNVAHANGNAVQCANVTCH